ncbi:hypothetical protein AB0J74_27335 [Asanoa sp. NPDC049573]|uniref:hypothetical protein n=1 Tax=Asanoa sp. NPDC049573 TaxID=3155396 RepID=UPI003439ABC2
MRRLIATVSATLAMAAALVTVGTPAQAASPTGSFGSEYMSIYVDGRGSYPSVQICDDKADGQRVRVQVSGSFGASAWAEDANGANTTCGYGYFSPAPKSGERLTITGWRQNGTNGTPNNWVQGAFTFSG